MGSNPTKLQELKSTFSGQKELVKLLYQESLPFLIGSDFGGMTFVYPGYSFHKEMHLLSQIGFNNYDILKMATYNPAVYFNIADKYGSTAKGKVADLVILDKNPVENIQNSLQIPTVIRDGETDDTNNIITLLIKNLTCKLAILSCISVNVNQTHCAMFKFLIFSAAIFLWIASEQPDTAAGADAYWAEVSRTVTEGDFEGYATLYHEDAVLVNGITGQSYPIAEALDGWQQGFGDTKAGRMTAGVEFRFSERIHGETTAHDTGIFRYSSQVEGGEARSSYVHFQGLLVKIDGEWKMTMEYQMSAATEEEWDVLEPGE